MKVYLAGPITSLTFEEATDWRALASSVLTEHGIYVMSPLRGKEYLRGRGPLADQYHGVHPLSHPRGVVTRDRWDCMRADVVLANLLGCEKPSIGTLLELAWADSARIPVVAVMETSGNPNDHAMVNELIGFRTADLDEALEIILTLREEI